MTLRYLLDTDVVSDLLRWPTGKVARTLERRGEHTICTSIIVAAELRYGGAKGGSRNLRERIEGLLDAIDVLPFDSPCDSVYAELRWALASRGSPIGPNDLLIASQALANELCVVTGNVSEFERVPGLRVENWRGS